MSGAHQPVLPNEVLAALQPVWQAPGPRRLVDVTGGRGGHSALLLAQLAVDDRLCIFDRDPAAIQALGERFADDPRVDLVQAPFDALAQLLEARGWLGRVDAILADLGVSSPQLDEAERGFSFLRDGPLDMRMDPSQGLSAAAWLAQVEFRELRRVLQEYGEEKAATRIAKAIIARRQDAPLLRTRELAELIADLLPAGKGIHPATRSFQAIRIQVNDELGQLQRFLPQALTALRPGGRLAIISFHSLEDRLVKRFFRAHEARPDPRLPLRAAELPAQPWVEISPAIRAQESEIAKNPRARSAVLRTATKNPEYCHAS
ncbi:16S rRNA (cytosine(1402)-N(4))-methyltransferase RsmH [Acidithiobacillus sp. CV18-2]|uniref:Ribosomal RNA small subunit methyltransferase H n=1 Tax=Igneacidithiobacillus copahuensis TaxID=2724909 RepID=A0AAE2YPD9_9PROT|nr:16S rRNA (cytosine(1402)-N(4))-methyltransferase RsmH [Igneacidithiobacillus copahuensis]MBU2755498.1 16S rRNA (cytosine(1402)-N(4))-methyltransferase RsmH [Acidithiobacillus sp. CV18-3]MBU2757831.1 16S rRNA (cytosine(1402)-N(4))-methyltransferase RsmH [Acidithiobacillus sp. BN09-2]MBU2777904.1 16S rRNA (cytosine(1402)-N(4))-methyltransferase RsmH [Acidithiobacillus sp. CV18-2]MBU2797830.1 16S rRNA (cytosine(1402)-N(4))-methyltransferase RsmH [Acidithiobacillus sp. VAN18-2]MBU2799324.1 16S 